MTTESTHVAEPGSVSWGTMRPEDLIPRFVEVLDALKESESLSNTPDPKRFGTLDDLLGGIEQRIKADEYYESEACSYDLDALFDALNDYAPPDCYFGAHEGDGANYGFWPSPDME